VLLIFLFLFFYFYFYFFARRMSLLLRAISSDAKRLYFRAEKASLESYAQYGWGELPFPPQKYD
jgi:hypothetical protein